jgi:hypothetical protein
MLTRAASTEPVGQETLQTEIVEAVVVSEAVEVVVEEEVAAT